jgi:actin-like ATPase involved in cell morphogenesis
MQWYDVAKLDPGAYKEARDNMGQQFMKEIKEKFQRKINLQRQRPIDKRIGAAKTRSRSRQDLDLNKSQDNAFEV